MNWYLENEHLSPAARARVDEYINLQIEGILVRAKHLNPDDVITARDIQDALDQSGHYLPDYDAHEQLYLTEYASRWPSVGDFYVLFAGFLALSAAVFALFGNGWSARLDGSFWVALLSFSASALAFSASTYRRITSRKLRSMMMRFAERSSQKSRQYRESVDLSSRADEKQADEATPLDVRFILQWSRVEDRLRFLLQNTSKLPTSLVADYPIGRLLQDLSEVGILNDVLGEHLRESLALRNQLAHGKHVSDEDLRLGVNVMSELEKWLEVRIEDVTAD